MEILRGHEIDLVKTPEVRRVVEAGAADGASVPESRLELLQLRPLVRAVPKCLWILHSIVGDAA